KLTFVDILRRLQKKGAPRPARAATTETENLSAWKTSMVHGAFDGGHGPEPIAFPDGDDLGATRAIPILQPRPEPVAAPIAAPVAAAQAPAGAVGLEDEPRALS